MANKIIEGIKSNDKGSFLKNLDFSHIASCLIWNAAEPTDKGGWPTVLQDICGREALAKKGDWSIRDVWAAMCDYLRREGIDDMRSFQEFCISHYQDIEAYALARGLAGPTNQGNGALGRELDGATISWLVD